MSASSAVSPAVVELIGGEGIGEQLLAVQKGCDVVVATPGRLLDVLGRITPFLDCTAIT